jgi:hypothetical protein
VENRSINAVIAFLLAGVSGLVAFSTLRLVEMEERGGQGRIGPLQPGQQSYRLIPATGRRDRCFGEISIDVDPLANERQVSITGAFDVTAQGRTIRPLFTGELNFNPLGQLGGSVFTLRVGSDELVVGTQGIAPITLLVKPAIQGRKFQFQFVLPGPIELQRLNASEYAVSSILLQPVTSGFSADGSELSTFALPRVERVAEGETVCPADRQTALDLDAMRATLAGRGSALQNALGTIFPGGLPW